MTSRARSGSVTAGPATPSRARLRPDQLGHRQRALVALLDQPPCHTLTVGRRTILAVLPLALDPTDLHLDPDDPLEHPIEEIGRGIRDVPRLLPVRLALGRQRVEVPQQPL